MKKITALILALVLALSLAACKGKTTAKPSASGSNLTTEEINKILAEEEKK